MYVFGGIPRDGEQPLQISTVDGCQLTRFDMQFRTSAYPMFLVESSFFTPI